MLFHHILEVNLGLGNTWPYFVGFMILNVLLRLGYWKLGIQNKLLNKVNANKTPHTQVEENVI